MQTIPNELLDVIVEHRPHLAQMVANLRANPEQAPQIERAIATAYLAGAIQFDGQTTWYLAQVSQGGPWGGDWLSTADASSSADYDDSHLRRLAAAGTIPALKYGKTWYLRRDAVAALPRPAQMRTAAEYQAWREEQARTMTAETFRPFIRRAARHVGKRRTEVADVARILRDHGFYGSEAQMIFDVWLDTQERTDPKAAAIHAQQAEIVAQLDELEPLDPARQRADDRFPLRVRLTDEEAARRGNEEALAIADGRLAYLREQHRMWWFAEHGAMIDQIAYEEAEALLQARRETA